MHIHMHTHSLIYKHTHTHTHLIETVKKPLEYNHFPVTKAAPVDLFQHKGTIKMSFVLYART
jgi:hypothetical protein